MTDTLARYPIALNALPAAIIERVQPVTAIVQSSAGRTVVALGDASTSVYLVLKGRVQVALFSTAGREVILRDLGPGALFGELAAIDDAPRSAAITAIEDCVLATIPGAAFRDAVAQSPDTALWMMQRFVAQVRELSERVFELNTLRVPSRLHCELLRLCHLAQGDALDGVIEPLPTHAELAARIGTHREAVTRELGYLSKQGIVKPLDRRRWQVDVARISALVQEAAGDLGQERRHWPGPNGNRSDR